MKNFLIVLTLTVASFANAQKGSFLLLGSVGYFSQKTSVYGISTTQNYFGFYPKAGYQFTDNWTVGAEAGASFQKSEFVNGDNKSDNYSLGAFVRYSKPLSDLFFIYADLGAGYRGSKETYTNLNSDPTTYSNKANGFYTTVTPALLINIKNGFGLNFGFGGLGYYSKNIDSGNIDADTKETGFNFNFGQSFTAGISKNF
jgi:hypothetical protein